MIWNLSFYAADHNLFTRLLQLTIKAYPNGVLFMINNGQALLLLNTCYIPPKSLTITLGSHQPKK